jgi:G3E family GTPase
VKTPLPVTLIGGFLGAGKTSFIHHIISEHRGGYLAVIVENPGPLNLDAKALRGLCGAMRRQQDTVLEFPAGDEAAQVGWLARHLRELCEAGRYERVLVELSGTSNPARLARYFQLPAADPQSLRAYADLQQIVCIVDALDYYQSGQAAEDMWRDFQSEMIAGATLVVLNKCDLLEEKQRDWCTRGLRERHPAARLIETAYGEMPPEIWSQPAPAGGFAQASANLAAIRTSRDTPPLACGLYRAWRPFHPGRFWDWFNADHPGLLRAKGIIWLATRNLLVGGISRMRWQNGCGAAGIWWAALPREEWPPQVEALARMQEMWREPYGDRRQELVLIGEEPALKLINQGLNASLLTETELGLGPKAWADLADPFPVWDVE